MSSANTSPTSFHRRNFLKTSSLLAGAVLLPAWSEAFNLPAGSLALGVLSPTSGLYPNVTNNFLAGLQSYFKRAGLSSPDLQPRSYASLEEARRLAHELVAAGVQGVVALITPTHAQYLQDLFDANGVPLFISTIGANALEAGKANGAAPVTSLAHWHAALGLGHWAARNLGPRAFMAASIHDGGYDALYAFQAGYESAGGTVTETTITHRPTDSPNLSEVMAAIQRANPSMVYAAYCGPQAIDFVRAYMAAGLSKSIPLAGTSFMGDDALLAAYGPGAPQLYTGLSEFNLINGQPAEPFTALGYHTGRQTANYFTTTSDKPTRPATYVRVSQSGKRLGRNPLLPSALPDPTLATVQARVGSEIKTGWLSEYGCN